MHFATKKDLTKLDELAVKNGVAIRQMMELAGWHILSVFESLHIAKDASITIVAGKGNKAGDGLCAARHLHNHGWQQLNIVTTREDLKSNPKHHLNTAKHLKIPITSLEDKASEAQKIISSSSIIIDALIGYNLRGEPSGTIAQAIDLINQAGKQVISYDLPSGLKPDKAEESPHQVKAYATLTLGYPKQVFLSPLGKSLSGQIFLADIGVPIFVYDQIKKDSRPNFTHHEDLILKLK